LNEKMIVEQIKSNKGKKSIVVAVFTYYKIKYNASYFLWTCNLKICTGSV
jgi:hypothetical protein